MKQKNETYQNEKEKHDLDLDTSEIEGREIDTKFPIVGIGASAGGLVAFEELFTGMPKDEELNMAFIVVQHLAPDHKSILSDIIKKYTKLHVYKVTDGMKVLRNCIYIIPSNRDMALVEGKLQLFEITSPRGKNMSIDFFLRSLALDQQEMSIAVILSGTGSDGTTGMKSIKEEGGIVVVQSPETAKYDGMPLSAISTGLVDYILPAKNIVKTLVSYVEHTGGMKKRLDSLITSYDENNLKKIFFLLRERIGHDFSNYKISTISRRIERRLAVLEIETIDKYVKYLQQNPKEIDALFHDFLISVTNFNRDKDAFSYLEKIIIPEIFNNKPDGSSIRIWCVGCATGEEAYSLAILIRENLEKTNNNYDVKIFATDIDNYAISKARLGEYSSLIEADISPEKIVKYFKFNPVTGLYKVRRTIRSMLIFSGHNVIEDPPFSKLDLITCRNLLIYLNKDLHKKLIPLFHYSLNPNGILFLGSSETAGEYNNLFMTLEKKFKIYLRIEDYSGKNAKGNGGAILKKSFNSHKEYSGVSEESYPKKYLSEIMEKFILKESSLTGILINEKGYILHLHGPLETYQKESSIDYSNNNIFKLVKKEISHNLSIGLHKITDEVETIYIRDIKIPINKHYTKINMTIKLVTQDSDLIIKEPLYIVFLEESREQDPIYILKPETDSSFTDMDTYLKKLKTELRIKEEYLYAANEKLEKYNEKLESSYQEMQAVNEEMQSTNEELETSQEELQSTNEELLTVNIELQERIHDLSKVNNDMNNLISGTNIATIFLDLDHNILRFTPTVTEIINLIANDIGRSISDITTNLVSYNNLSKDINAVLDTLKTKKRKVHTTNGRWYEMIIQPYRTIENIVQGAVITFIDNTEAKTAKDLLSVSELKYRTLFETAKEGILILNSKTGQILDVNPYLVELLGYSKHEFIKKEIWKIDFLNNIVENKEEFKEFQKKKSVRYENYSLNSASGKSIEVEIASNSFEINRQRIIQCNIRKVI